MITIKTNKGNMLQNVKSGIIVHGLSAQGVMGSGFAKQIKQTYPEAFKIYIDAHKEHGKLELGSCTVVQTETNKGLFIVNAVTQKFYGKDGKRYADYDAIKMCFEKINTFALRAKIKSINFPKIGAGLGGGDWSIIEKIIDEELDDCINKNLWIL